MSSSLSSCRSVNIITLAMKAYGIDLKINFLNDNIFILPFSIFNDILKVFY